MKHVDTPIESSGTAFASSRSRKNQKNIRDQQFGFTKNKSTDTALFIHITNTINGIETNNVTVGVYLDLAKAFDTVNHFCY